MNKAAQVTSANGGWKSLLLKLLPGLIAAMLIWLSIQQFRGAAESGKYYIAHTLLLYLSLFSAGAVIIHYVLRKWQKVLLFNWVLIFIIVSIFEGYLRISNRKDILNYAEKNEGYFTTQLIQEIKSLENRKPGDVLYLNSATAGSYRMSRPEFDYTYQLDAYGFNNRPSCVLSGGYRILTLGDSFTWGIGAPADSSWPAQLEQMLAPRIPNLRVCNAGISGSDPIYNFEAYRRHYEKAFYPDLVIVAFNMSDVSDVIIRGGQNRYLPGQKPGLEIPSWLPWYASSLIYRSFKRNMGKLDANLLIEEDEKYQRAFKAFTDLMEAMVAFHQYQKVRGKAIVFLYTPVMQDIIDGRSFMTDLINEMRNAGLPVIDATPAFLAAGVNAGNMNRYFWPIDAHNTPEGYHLIAQIIAESLAFTVKD